MIDNELYETKINGFDFKFEADEGYWDVSYLEPKTGKWENLSMLGGSLNDALAEVTEEASQWDFDEE